MNKKILNIILFLIIIIILLFILVFSFYKLERRIVVDDNVLTDITEENELTQDITWGKCVFPYGIRDGIDDFDCPSWMQNIYWDAYPNNNDINTWKFYFYNSLDNEIQRGYISTKTGRTVFITDEQEYAKDKTNLKEKSYLKFLDIENKEVRTIYEIDGFISVDVFSDMKFSPDGKFVSFIRYGYEWFDSITLNIDDGTNILEDNDIQAGLDDMIWSSNSDYLMIGNHLNEFGGEGFNGVVLFDISNGSHDIVFEAPYDLSNQYVYIDELGMDGRFIYFARVQGDDRVYYKYDILNEKLEVRDIH